MVVDDELYLRTFLYEVLSEQYEVSVADSGAQALRMVKVELPAVILLDILMPEMDGI